MSVPIVPLSAFSNLAGASLAGDLRRLIASPDYAGLVLFSDTLGEQLAILPVGPGQAYPRLEDVSGAEIEGLRPLCALRLRGGGKGEGDAAREQELARREEALARRERELDEREQALVEREQMHVEKEREFFRRSGATARQTVNA